MPPSKVTFIITTSVLASCTKLNCASCQNSSLNWGESPRENKGSGPDSNQQPQQVLLRHTEDAGGCRAQLNLSARRKEEARKSPQKHSAAADGLLGLNHLARRRPIRRQSVRFHLPTIPKTVRPASTPVLPLHHPHLTHTHSDYSPVYSPSPAAKRRTATSHVTRPNQCVLSLQPSLSGLPGDYHLSQCEGRSKHGLLF